MSKHELPMQVYAWPANRFDQNEHWISVIFLMTFVICGVVSGYATFSGIRLFLSETGEVGLLTDGTSVILTIAVVAILTVGWGMMLQYGPEARTGRLKAAMLGLASVLFVMTLCVSSLSNLMALVGPSAKIHDWRQSHEGGQAVTNAYGARSLAVAKIRPGWLAEQARACDLAQGERSDGLVSTVGKGVGPVAVALQGVCSQTTAFVAAIDEAIARTNEQVAQAHQGLDIMELAARSRGQALFEREDAFLHGGRMLNQSIQLIRAADLTDVLDAGAAQVAASIGELGDASSFRREQVEMVRSLKESISGLVEGTRIVSERLRGDALPDYHPPRSPDFIEAILTHSGRFLPVFAAAIAIDGFQLWALGFVLVARGGRAGAVPRSDGTAQI